MVLAGLLVAQGRPGFDVEAVGGINTLTVTPPHGRAAASFVATYSISPCPSNPGLTITFSWGALATAGQVLGSATTDASCRASLTTKPPVNPATHQLPAPGTYQVFGYVALPTGDASPGTDVSTGYTVDVTPAPSGTHQASATPTATARASSSASTAPTRATASPATSATGAAPATATSGGRPLAKSTAGQSSPGTWQLSWLEPALLAGVALLLGLLAILGFLMRRRVKAKSQVERRNDRAA
jgi:hypothetical protein